MSIFGSCTLKTGCLFSKTLVCAESAQISAPALKDAVENIELLAKHYFIKSMSGSLLLKVIGDSGRPPRLTACT